MVSKQMEKRNATNQKNYTVENVDNPIVDDSNVLTRQDNERAQNGEPPIQYDAYLLYEDSDAPFAAQLFHKMKDVYGLEVIYKFTVVAFAFFSYCVLYMVYTPIFIVAIYYVRKRPINNSNNDCRLIYLCVRACVLVNLLLLCVMGKCF